jgi:transcriptional regulator with XRE-family HTH domain
VLSQMKARMTDNKNDLGKMIKQQRLMMRLTLRDVSTASGVSSSHLGRIERCERFPSVHTLRKIAKPLGFEETELFYQADFLSPKTPVAGTEGEHNVGQLDPYVAMVLSQKPVEVQRTIIGILSILKFVGKATRAAKLPELREYLQQKYPYLDEDLVTMIENLTIQEGQKVWEG